MSTAPSIADSPRVSFTDPLLPRAWEQPVAALYQRRGLLTQTARALCGPTSAAMVLSTIGAPVEASRVLRGTSVATFFGLRLGGLTLDQLGEVIRTHSTGEVTLLRDLTVDQLRAELARANDLHYRYVANFDRGPLFGFGGGHHSPVGAYLPDADRVLVLDVNRRFGPWTTSTAALHAALSTRDRASGSSRGVLRLELQDPPVG